MHVCGPTGYREHRTANIVMFGARDEAGQAGWDSVQRNKVGWSLTPNGQDTPHPPLHPILSQGDWVWDGQDHLYTPTGYHCTPQLQKEPTTKAHIVTIWGRNGETGNLQRTCSPLFSYHRIQCILEKDTNTTAAKDTGPLVRLIHTAEGLSLGKGSQHDLGKIC